MFQLKIGEDSETADCTILLRMLMQAIVTFFLSRATTMVKIGGGGGRGRLQLIGRWGGWKKFQLKIGEDSRTADCTILF